MSNTKCQTPNVKQENGEQTPVCSPKRIVNLTYSTLYNSTLLFSEILLSKITDTDRAEQERFDPWWETEDG